MDHSFIDLSLYKALHGSGGVFQLEIRLEVEKCCFLGVRGPSGAGKTTLLRMIAGLSNPESGFIRIGQDCWFDSQTNKNLKVQKRNIGLVFQDFALFPNMTVAGQLRYAMAGKTDKNRIFEYLDLVGLAQLGRAYPSQLSGGQKQRLALIRTLARKPDILLLDEPLASLDPEMREHLQEEILRLHRIFNLTTIMVSHDATELLRLCDRIIEVDKGQITSDYAVGSANMMKQENALNCLEGYFLSYDPSGAWIIVEINGRPCRIKTPQSFARIDKGQKINFSANQLCFQQ